MHKLIVMSATYRHPRTSRGHCLSAIRITGSWRALRGLRLPAEMIRDQAALRQRVLVEKVGGPSVMPYSTARPVERNSPALTTCRTTARTRRRQVYTFWKRTSAPAQHDDLRCRGSRVVQRSPDAHEHTVASVGAHDEYLVEAARVFAQRIVDRRRPPAEERISFAFRLATSRLAKPDETSRLVSSGDEFRSRYQLDSSSASTLVNAAKRRETTTGRSDLAAYTSVASSFLN